MMRPYFRLASLTTAHVLLAGLILVNSGCLLIAAGAAGGAAAGYAYCRGKVCESFNAGFDDAWAATHAALVELGMPIESEERDKGIIHSRTADGDRVRIALEFLPSKFPAEGSVTHICVRVAMFGDHPVSNRLLDQIGMHLAPVGSAPPPGATLIPPQAAAGPGQPPNGVMQAGAVPQSAPPPVLPPEPVPARK